MTNRIEYLKHLSIRKPNQNPFDTNEEPIDDEKPYPIPPRANTM